MKGFRAHRSRQRGIALLAVLSLITLVVVLLLAFLVVMMLDRKTTSSYSQSIKAQEIGLGALEEITSDLKQEIAAGSNYNNSPTGATYAVTDPVTSQPLMAFVPASNSGGVSYSAVPARIGFPASNYGTDVDSTGTLLPPTFVRVSRDSSDPFYSGNIVTSSGTISGSTYYPQKWAALPPARATTTSTTALSINSRSISVNRWNKPQIMNANAAPPTDFTANPPEWVYVGRSGSLNTTTGVAFTDADAAGGTLFADAAGTNTNGILGRYAFAMYDEGALLDANVAGADSTTVGVATSPNAPFRNKAFLSYADLTQIPGFTQAALTNLVGWRNQGGLAAWGNFNNLVAGADAIGFLTFFGPHNTGSTSAYPSTSAASHNDNPFLSRQDLIDYCTNVLGATGTSSPLPYLATFTRAVNAPAAIPTFNAPSATATLYQYAKNAENTSTTSPTNGTPNRDFANVRLGGTSTTSVTFTHYKDDGTTTTYTVDPGAPLLQRRFSLAKIAWIGYNGPNAAAFNSSLSAAQQAAAIQDCFGLVWDTNPDPSNANLPYNTWDYVGGTNDGYSTASPPNIINTLAQVAALSTPREPNFFELLKAGILNGSLGRDPGIVAKDSISPGVAGALFDSYSALPDAHLIQIGANIIDQATQDGYPTAIYFAQHNPATYPSPYYRLFDTACGIKDLPYLYRIFPQCYTTSLTGNTTFPNPYGTCQGWFQPELWNPHQNPSTGTTPTTRPSAFRVRAHGGAQFVWHQLTTQGIPSSVGNDRGIATDPPVTINYESTTAGTANYTSANPSNPSVPSCVYFRDPSGNTFREQPLMLTTSNTDTATTTANSPQNVWQSSWTPEYANSSPNQYLGIWVGSDPNYNPNVNYPLNPLPPAAPTNAPGSISHVCEYETTTPVPAGQPAYPTMALEYEDPGGNYHPYNLMSRFIQVLGSNSTAPTAASNQKDNLSTWATENTGVPTHMDPRTDRFACSSMGPDPFAIVDAPNWNYADTQMSFFYGPSSPIAQVGNPPIPSGASSYFFYVDAGTATSGTTPTKPYYLTTWIQNQTQTQNIAQGALNPSFVTGAPNNYSYYLDPDQMPTQGITVDAPRPADGFRWSDPASSRGNGLMLFHTSTANPAGAGTDEAPQRPVILNRPFRSVGEIGYAFRDVPFKSIDFWSQYSPDAALLDLFSVQDEPAVVAGQVDLNNAPVTVLKAILSEGALKEIDPTVNYTAAELKAVATAVATYVSSNGPLKNRQDLVTGGSGLYSNSPSTATDLSDKIYAALAGASSNKYWGNKAYGEAPVRALAPVTNIRTWNLLVDVIAQSGHMETNAKKLADFVVDSEKRYWLHIAIDRYTGQVVDEQLEPVYE